MKDHYKCKDCHGRGNIDGFDCKCCDGLGTHFWETVSGCLEPEIRECLHEAVIHGYCMHCGARL